jgi:uncharacterized membrane protein YwzB
MAETFRFTTTRWRRWIMVVLSMVAVNAVPPAACFLFINLVSFSDPRFKFDSPILAGVALAPIVAQFVVLAIWSSCGSGNVWRRAILALLIAYCITCATFVSGQLILPIWVSLEQGKAALWYVPLWLLSFQIPAATIAILCKWRIRGSHSRAVKPPTLRIIHLFAILAYTGVALTLARQVATRESAPVLAVCCLLAALWSFATGLPCLRLCLTQSRSVASRLAIVVISMLLSAAISSFLLSRFPASSSMVDNLAFVSAFHPTLTTCTIAALCTGRLCGFTIGSGHEECFSSALSACTKTR